MDLDVDFDGDGDGDMTARALTHNTNNAVRSHVTMPTTKLRTSRASGYLHVAVAIKVHVHVHDYD